MWCVHLHEGVFESVQELVCMSQCMCMPGKNMSRKSFFRQLFEEAERESDLNKHKRWRGENVGRFSGGHLTVWKHTHFKHAVNIQKVLLEALLNNARFTADLWSYQPLWVSGQLTPTACQHSWGHTPVFPLACVCDFLKHCCVNKPKWDRKDGVCPGHVDVWRLSVRKKKGTGTKEVSPFEG